MLLVPLHARVAAGGPASGAASRGGAGTGSSPGPLRRGCVGQAVPAMVPAMAAGAPRVRGGHVATPAGPSSRPKPIVSWSPRRAALLTPRAPLHRCGESTQGRPVGLDSSRRKGKESRPAINPSRSRAGHRRHQPAACLPELARAGTCCAALRGGPGVARAHVHPSSMFFCFVVATR